MPAELGSRTEDQLLVQLVRATAEVATDRLGFSALVWRGPRIVLARTVWVNPGAKRSIRDSISAAASSSAHGERDGTWA